MKPKASPNILPMSRVYHDRSFFLTFNTQNQDMCHGTIDFDLVEI